MLTVQEWHLQRSGEVQMTEDSLDAELSPVFLDADVLTLPLRCIYFFYKFVL